MPPTTQARTFSSASGGTASWANALRLSRYQVVLRAFAPLDLPEYLGSTLRGAFGHAFRRVACLAPQGASCPAPESCPYHAVFETRLPPGAEALRSFDEIPRPFVIVPPSEAARVGEGGDLAFGLTLIGRAREFFPHFVVTLRELRVLGRGRHPVELRAVDAVDPWNGGTAAVYSEADRLVRAHDSSLSLADCGVAPAPPNRSKIRFLTLTRLKHEGGFSRRPELHVLLRRLLGRLSSLALFHCGVHLDLDFVGLIERAKRIRLVDDRTHWRDWTRYSSRQGRRMTFGGLVGEALYEGPLEEVWPFLVFGQWTHVGKNATFGLGRYEIVTPDTEDP